MLLCAFQNLQSLYFLGNVDYYPGPYSVTFPAGETRASFNVLIADDNIVERDEAFTLYINANTLPSGGVRIRPYSVSIIIEDYDCKLLIITMPNKCVWLCKNPPCSCTCKFRILNPITVIEICIY